MVRDEIYLDYNASTPLATEVRDAMAPFLSAHHGNPSSGHWASEKAAAAIANARRQVAELIGAESSELFFTGGGTESNNWALKGAVAHARRKKGIDRPHLVISAVEHPSVTATCRYLEAFGVRFTEVGVDCHGWVDPNDIQGAIEPTTVLVSVMHANNEVGTIQPIREIAAVAGRAGVLMHTDAAQSLGKIPVDVRELGVDLLTVAGHKLYAPKGVGALYVRAGVEIDNLLHGGGHESGRRAGTENTASIVGLGAASALATTSPCADALQALADHLREGIASVWGERAQLLGHPERRLPNTVNVGFVGRIGAEVLAQLPAIAASTGSACHAGVRSLSPVLTAMGVPEDVGLGAVRFSVGRPTRRDELDRVLDLLRNIS